MKFNFSQNTENFIKIKNKLVQVKDQHKSGIIGMVGGLISDNIQIGFTRYWGDLMDWATVSG